jgi:hypothetical protein
MFLTSISNIYTEIRNKVVQSQKAGKQVYSST